ATGCGGSKDVCDRLADKLQTVGKERGVDRDKIVGNCRKNIDRVKNDPRTECILAADDAAALEECGAVAEERRVQAGKAGEGRADEAMKRATELSEKVDAIAHDLDEPGKKIDAAVASLTQAQDDAARKAAEAKLAELQREKAEMERRIAEAKAAAARAERSKG